MTQKLAREEQYRQLVQKIDALLSKGNVQDAVQCANKNFRKLSDEERLQMFELFTRPGLRFSEATKGRGVKIARKILAEEDNVKWSTRMRATGLLRMLGGESEEDTRTVDVQDILKSSTSPQEKQWVAAAAAPLMENGEEAATCVRAIIEGGNAVLIRDVVIPTVKKTLPNNTGIALLKQALTKLKTLHNSSSMAREKSTIEKVHGECKKLHDALIPYVKEQLENIQTITKEMDEMRHQMREMSDEHLKRTYMENLNGMYKKLEKTYRHNIPMREWARISHNMSVAAGWAGLPKVARKYTADAVLALGTQRGKKGDRLAELIGKQQELYGLTHWGEKKLEP